MHSTLTLHKTNIHDRNNLRQSCPHAVHHNHRDHVGTNVSSVCPCIEAEGLGEWPTVEFCAPCGRPTPVEDGGTEGQAG